MRYTSIITLFLTCLLIGFQKVTITALHFCSSILKNLHHFFQGILGGAYWMRFASSVISIFLVTIGLYFLAYFLCLLIRQEAPKHKSAVFLFAWIISLFLFFSI